jgi:hypothetical protein
MTSFVLPAPVVYEMGENWTFPRRSTFLGHFFVVKAIIPFVIAPAVTG